MTESAVGKALRKAVTDDVAGLNVYFKMPRRKRVAPFTLKEEVDQRKEPLFIEAVCGIVGPLDSGRKFLGDRFVRINEEIIEEINNIQLCYTGNLNMVDHGRPVQASVKAYIIPPPYTEEKVPLYIQASHQFCCLLFVFDVTNPESYCAAQDCIKSMKFALPDNYFFVGNKCDLRGTVPKCNEVQQQSARMKALQLGAKGYFECSAKFNTNVKPLMEAIVRCERDRLHT